MAKVEVYSMTVCPWCVNAKKFLESKGIEYTEIKIDRDIENGREKLSELTGGERTVPQIFVDGKHIGGYDELVEMGNNGELEKLVSGGDTSPAP